METKVYNLKQLIELLLLRESAIEQIHLFGSRGYRTGSTRSDCDLLIEFDQTKNLKSSDLRDFATVNCPALDFFLVTGGRATSCSNDSFVFAHSADELKSRLDAKLLWNKQTGFSASPFDDDNWVFETRSFVEFGHTALPDGHISELTWNSKLKRAEQNFLPTNPYIGDTIEKAAALISDVARKMIIPRSELCPKGNAKAGWTVRLESEYDCQNLFFTVLRPWIGRIGREEATIKFDGQDKVADFNLFDDQLIIEMKFIDSDQKKREVVKTLAGLSAFYSRNSNIRVLLMLIFVKHGIAVDGNRWEADFTHVTNSPMVITWVISIP
jgi:hypothetical protein